MDLRVKRKDTGELINVRKYIKSENPNEEHIWSNEWYGHHIIGIDCVWVDVPRRSETLSDFLKWTADNNYIPLSDMGIKKILEYYLKSLNNSELRDGNFSRSDNICDGVNIRITPINVNNAIPYQKCPNCEGLGKSHLIGLNIPSDSDVSKVSLDYKDCHICNGEGIIPMYVQK